MAVNCFTVADMLVSGLKLETKAEIFITWWQLDHHNQLLHVHTLKCILWVDFAFNNLF